MPLYRMRSAENNRLLAKDRKGDVLEVEIDDDRSAWYYLREFWFRTCGKTGAGICVFLEEYQTRPRGRYAALSGSIRVRAEDTSAWVPIAEGFADAGWLGEPAGGIVIAKTAGYHEVHSYNPDSGETRAEWMFSIVSRWQVNYASLVDWINESRVPQLSAAKWCIAANQYEDDHPKFVRIILGAEEADLKELATLLEQDWMTDGQLVYYFAHTADFDQYTVAQLQHLYRLAGEECPVDTGVWLEVAEKQRLLAKIRTRLA